MPSSETTEQIVWDFRAERDGLAEAQVSELLCTCGALYIVYARTAERPILECSWCAGIADGELPALGLWPDDTAFDENGPDIQVVLASAPMVGLDIAQNEIPRRSGAF